MAVLALALSAAPRTALAAMMALLKGKKLRAWNLLSAAAQEHRNSYAAWIAIAEANTVARWQAGENPGEVACLPILALILDNGDGDETEKTRAALRASLGDSVEIVVLPSGRVDRRHLAAILSDRTGDWILPVLAGDRVSKTLSRVAARAVPTVDNLIYWDEDRVEKGVRCDPLVKPDWDPLLFQGGSGLLGSSLLRAATVRQCIANGHGGADVGDWQDMFGELCFSLAETGSVHIPLILTHRGGSAMPVQAVAAPDPQSWPSVSIIIPTRDLAEDLTNCLNGLRQLNYPGSVETILVDNGSTDPSALSLLKACDERADTTVLRIPGPFNFSALNNAAVLSAKGDLLCLLNNDVEPLDGEWLTHLVRHAALPGVGATGAMLLYPDGAIQHAGVAIGLGGAAGHVQKGTLPGDMLYRHWARSTRRVSAVTAACLVVKRASFDAVGGFDETAFAVAFNDVDLCLKLDRAGLQNRYVAEARLIHHESKSRGEDLTDEKRARFAGELHRLQERWETKDYQDPWFSPLFARSSERCTLQF